MLAMVPLSLYAGKKTLKPGGGGGVSTGIGWPQEHARRAHERGRWSKTLRVAAYSSWNRSCKKPSVTSTFRPLSPSLSLLVVMGVGAGVLARNYDASRERR